MTGIRHLNRTQLLLLYLDYYGMQKKLQEVNKWTGQGDSKDLVERFLNADKSKVGVGR